MKLFLELPGTDTPWVLVNVDHIVSAQPVLGNRSCTEIQLITGKTLKVKVKVKYEEFGGKLDHILWEEDSGVECLCEALKKHGV